MVTKHKSKATFDKERKDQKRVNLHNNEQVRELLDLYGLSLVEEMHPKFGANHQMKLSVYQDKTGGWELQTALPTLDNLCQHLGFARDQGFDEIQTLELPSKYRERLLKDALKRAKNDLNKHLHKIRPFLLERGAYLYTIPLSQVETVIETGDLKRTGSTRLLLTLPLSTQLARKCGCSEEEVKALAPLVAWLIPRLILYGKVKDADKLMLYLDGWCALLTSQQHEQMSISALKHNKHVIDAQIHQLLLFPGDEE